MAELADIARCSANALSEDDRSMNYLLTCLEDLSVVVGRRKFDALTVETFGARIEKLIRSVFFYSFLSVRACLLVCWCKRLCPVRVLGGGMGWGRGVCVLVGGYGLKFHLIEQWFCKFS